MTRARLRPRAEADLVAQAHHCRSIEGPELATRFFNEALRALERAPLAGPGHVGEVADIPGLRSWPVPRFPVRWYYFATSEVIDVVRLLVDRRDLAAVLNPEPEGPDPARPE